MPQFEPALKFQIEETQEDPVTLLDENNFYHQRQGSPSELTRKVTYMLGSYTKNYPISVMTLGGTGFSNKLDGAAKELDDVQFTYPVMGRRFRPSITSTTTYTSTDKIGIGRSEFFLYFPDNMIKRFWIIQSHHGYQAYVHEDPVRMPDGNWRYKCQLDPANEWDSLPLSEAETGAAWVPINTQVAESQSRGTTTSMHMPGSYKNQMGFMRSSMEFAGNVANKVMKIEMQTDKGKTNVWMDWFMYLFELSWMDQCENIYWYSRYNRALDGTIGLKDLATGKVIPRGAGILEQIANKSSYASLTYNNLMNFVSESLYGMSDADNMVIDLWTGRGGLREIDRAMKSEAVRMGINFSELSDKFVTGSGRDLMLGGFFSGFYTIDGYTIRVKYNPVFDHGAVAQGQHAGGYVHPETGFPMESYRMVFLDTKDYDGQPNVQHVAQKGRSFIDGVIPGLTPLPKSLSIMLNNTENNVSKLLVNDVDQAGYTRMKSAGIQILRANRCFDLQCIAGD